jgi:hypothetical protein
MKRTTAAAIVALAGITVMALTVARAQPQVACLHADNETPADAARRFDAIRIIRVINTLQVQTYTTTGAYRTFRELSASGLPSRPAGFSTQLTVEGSTYAVAVKDATDPCGYTLFSDQDGLIYVGSPLQRSR